MNYSMPGARTPVFAVHYFMDHNYFPDIEKAFVIAEGLNR